MSRILRLGWVLYYLRIMSKFIALEMLERLVKKRALQVLRRRVDLGVGADLGIGIVEGGIDAVKEYLGGLKSEVQHLIA